MVSIMKGDAVRSGKDVIVHQVNCQGVMGSGIARQIKYTYPEVYRSYQRFCEQHTPEELLGCMHLVPTSDGRYVANIFGQLDYGTDKQYTDYKALESGLKVLAARIGPRKLSIAMPVGIGCGRGGGDWDVVLPMIRDIFKDCDVTLYKL